ncbi:MAG: T9SS type A sorting domain-containing protein, partial [Bacteroidetes bacterium]|nr:T9SS type A sorting domain-containing protein [Bacteroidota bacterium]
ALNSDGKKVVDIGTGSSKHGHLSIFRLDETTEGVHLSANPGEVMWLNNGGNVAIGKETAGYALDVEGQIAALSGSSTSPGFSMINSLTNAVIELGTLGNHATLDMYKSDGTTQAVLFTASPNKDMYLNNGGMFGIGTDSPAERLDLGGGAITVDGTDGTGDEKPGMRPVASGQLDIGWGSEGGANIELYSKGHATTAERIRLVYGQAHRGVIEFVHYDGTTQNVQAILDSTGKFGIGTSTPGDRLEINSGTANKSGLRFTNLNINSTVATPQVGFCRKVLTVNVDGEVILVDLDSCFTSSKTGGGSVDMERQIALERELANTKSQLENLQNEMADLRACISELTDCYKVTDVGGSNIMLDQNYPNPFSRSTTITYHLSESGTTELRIFDAMGVYLESLVNEDQVEGSYSVVWDANGLPAGIYTYTLTVDGEQLYKKAIILK